MSTDHGIDNGADASYYEIPPNCTRLYDIIVSKNMQWDQGNIVKAAYRWNAKPDLEYNLLKIKFHVDNALRRLYANDPENPRHESV